jgi:hypothetical protein
MAFVFVEDRYVSTDIAYMLEVGDEAYFKYTQPAPEPDLGTPLKLFESDTGKKPTAKELYQEQRRRG